MIQSNGSGPDGADDRRPIVLAKVQIPEVTALRLDRLEARLEGVWERRLGVVVAPAGSGKTTLLAGFAGTTGAPVAWYRAESWDARLATLLRHLHRAVGAALHNSPDALPEPAPWTTVEEAVTAIEELSVPRMLLVVDDLHALEGTDAEAALERLIEYAPARLGVIVASRTQPQFNLPRRRLEGTLLEIGSDDLRFRSWEVERLFRDIYRLALPPQELAALARRTEGWAAGLQLFRLAVQGKSADERRRLLQEAGSSVRFLREYLARNVLSELPADLAGFLVETCVLGRLSGSLCDGLLERTGSAAHLEELERRQIFTTRLDDGSYRYHEVLRTYLEATLIERFGETATRERYERAGRLLLAHEELGEALTAFARAANWEAVERLVSSRGEQLLDDPAPRAWLDALPGALARNDPWLVLASARQARDEGRWSDAAAGFLLAETAFGSSEGAALARRERAALLPWVDRTPPPRAAADGSTILRRAVTRDPDGVRSAAAALGGPWRDLVAGIAALLANRPADAGRDLQRVGEHAGVSPALVEAASLATVAAAVLQGDATATADALALDRADDPAVSWLGRIGRALACIGAAGGAPDTSGLVRLQQSCRDVGDVWGEAVIGLIEGWLAIHDGGDDLVVTRLEAVATRARGVGAGVLEAWLLAIAAIVARKSGDSRGAALEGEARRAARGAACRAPVEMLIAPLPRAIRKPAQGGPAQRGTVEPVPRAIRVRIRCFGEFSFEIDGRPVGHTSIRPRARSVLHLLAIHAGEAIHREVLEASIWPSETTGAAAARLQVAISSIRRLFQDGAAELPRPRVDRDREAYRLVLPEPFDLDVRSFETAVVQARLAADGGDHDRASALAARAVDAYRGPLLVEEGPADWVLEPRERYRALAIETLELQARLALLRHDSAAAVAACSAGISLERFHDPFWRLLIEAREMAGDRGAAVRAEADYEGMLQSLGVAPALRTGGR